MQVTTSGLDIAKNVFQVHGVDAEGEPVIRRQPHRSQVLKVFAALGPCLYVKIVMMRQKKPDLKLEIRLHKFVTLSEPALIRTRKPTRLDFVDPRRRSRRRSSA